MGFYTIYCSQLPSLTLLVRAPSEVEACDVGASVAAVYLGETPTVTATLLDADGPTSVMIEHP